MIQVGREAAYQPVLIEVGAGALHVHLFLGCKFSANPIVGGGACKLTLKVPARPRPLVG
jgi:hypothetical protein